MAAPKDFLSILDLDPARLDALLTLARRMKADRAKGPNAPTAAALSGLHIALLFEKPSLRTRSTFEIAIRELDRATDRRGVEAIDTSFETATVFDLVTSPRRIELVTP